jgi:CheY-like chemotaxis protein
MPDTGALNPDQLPGQQTILIVEDDPAIRDVVRDFLDSVGYRTLVARDGDEAVAISHAARPDLIVMDLMLPRLTGGEVAARLKADLPTARIPIIAVSAVDDVDDIAELLPLDAVISKPFDLDSLHQTIASLLPGGPEAVIAQSGR